MRTVTILSAIVLSLCLTTAVCAERVLSRAEVLGVLQQLTDSPRDTWIPAGTIQATHQEYGAARTTNATLIGNEIQKAIQEYQSNPNKRELTTELQKMRLDAIPFNVRYRLANEHAMSSGILVKYDGRRFYWEIKVTSRRDTVRPEASLADNFLTEEFDLSSNEHRIFAWDGQKYTTYTASGGQAVVDAADRLPRAVRGPLTAGLIPWGHDRYAYADLAAAQTSAKEVTLDGKTQIEMTITYSDGAVTGVTLDPAKAYAVTAATFDGGGDEIVSYACSGYRLVGSRWVPSGVTIERRDRITDKLLKSEEWTLTSVNTSVPAPNDFTVPFGLDTLVEHTSPLSTASSIYVYSPTVDTDELLAQRLAYAAAQGRRPQNCGTAALECVASQLGKPVSGSALARLVGSDGRTNLLAMKQFAQGLGLYGRAVKTDLAGLRDLDGVKAILHIPGKNHFVVLNEVDERYVWLIDLSSDKFHYRQSADFFPQEWSEGTALLLSNRPLAARLPEIPDGVLQNLAGGQGWSCNILLQNDQIIHCDASGGYCGGALTVYWERWGCGQSPSGTCTNQKMIMKQESACIWDPIYDCTPDGQWYYYYMRACQ